MTTMKNIKGFSLVEVLVAVVILSTALLGLVGLQTAGVRNVMNSYNRTQASQLASSMADRMRANVADLTSAAKIGGGSSSYIDLTPATAGSLITNCYSTTGCTAAQMAQNDLAVWNAALIDPSNGLVKTGTITVAPFNLCPQAAPPPFQVTITVSWTENLNEAERDRNHDGTIDAADDLQFQTIFQIPRYRC